MKKVLDLLQNGNEEEKESAAARLMEQGESALPGLEAVLASGNPDARWWAVRALAEIPGSTAVRHLVTALKDPDEDLAVCAAMGLGERREGSPKAVKGLLALLQRPSTYVARHVGDALSKIGEPAVPGLITALEDPIPSVRVQAARALVRIESHQAIPALIQALDDPEAAVEYYAWEALQRMGVGTTLFFKP